MKDIVNLKAKLAKEFSMKDLDPAKKILEMRISRVREKRLLRISLAKYVEKVLKRFNMSDAKHVNVPLGGHFKLSKVYAPTTKDEKALMSEVSHASAVGSFMYAMVCTRSDIA